jgi:23S rRNA (guanosine2251-2'-O)-methyltransferase
MTDRKRPPSAKDSHYARLRRQHRDRMAGTAAGGDPIRRRPAAQPSAKGGVLLYGLHTVRAALDNPRRVIHRMLVTRNAMERLRLRESGAMAFPVELVEPRKIDAILGSDAVHQGVVIEADPLRPKRLGDLGDVSLVIVLDQVTDPHNVGAIMRSAVAFGAEALITTYRNSPQESGVLAKAASGALEHIDHMEVRNLSQALEELRASGFQAVGLDSEGLEPIEGCFRSPRVALVLGAEGKGLRQKTRQSVDVLARLDMPGPIRSLNVSNAAAVALYAARRHLADG